MTNFEAYDRRSIEDLRKHAGQKRFYREQFNIGKRTRDAIDDGQLTVEVEGYICAVERFDQPTLATQFWIGEMLCNLVPDVPINYCPMCGRKLVQTDS